MPQQAPIPPTEPLDAPAEQPLHIPRLPSVPFIVQPSAHEPSTNGVHVSREAVPIYFVFRRNGIYESYVSEIQAILREKGCTVQVVSLPADLEGPDISLELKRRNIPFDHCVLFTDRTVGQRLPRGHVFAGLSGSSIDDMFAGCGLRLICQELGIKFIAEVEVEEKAGQTFLQGYLEAHERRFKSVFERALNVKKPDMIVIDSRCMNEHVPFCVLSSKHPDRQAARLLRRWIADIGFPISRMMVTDDISKLDPNGFVECKRIWFIGDRHWQDKPPGKAELSVFVRELTELQQKLLVDEAMEDAKHRRELHELDEALDEDLSMPWDGDDGIDPIDQIDMSEPDRSNVRRDGEQLVDEQDEDLQERIEALEASTFRLSYLDVPQALVSARYLAVPMDSLLESMVAQELLPINHAAQGPRLVALAAQNIFESFPALADSVRFLKSKHS